MGRGGDRRHQHDSDLVWGSDQRIVAMSVVCGVTRDPAAPSVLDRVSGLGLLRVMSRSVLIFHSAGHAMPEERFQVSHSHISRARVVGSIT